MVDGGALAVVVGPSDGAGETGISFVFPVPFAAEPPLPPAAVVIPPVLVCVVFVRVPDPPPHAPVIAPRRAVAHPEALSRIATEAGNSCFMRLPSRSGLRSCVTSIEVGGRPATYMTVDLRGLTDRH
jgi:hypothetical protein